MNITPTKPLEHKSSDSSSVLAKRWIGSHPSSSSNMGFQNLFNFGQGSSLNLINITNLIIGILQQVTAQLANNRPTSGFGNQTPVTVVENLAAKTTSINGQTYDNAFLRTKLEEFKNSSYYPPVQTRDLITTAWGYQGSGSALRAFYNYVATKYPEDTTKNSLARSVASAPSTVAASTSDTTSIVPDSSATPLDAVLEAAASGSLSNPQETVRAAVSAPPANS
jgi:hypothetical protein